MELAVRLVSLSFLVVALSGILGCQDLGVPAPCSFDSDCPSESTCVPIEGLDGPGFCEGDETDGSLGAPALCSLDDDCPEGIACVRISEDDEFGFCDVVEMLAP